jgi:hypothetical protein
LVIEFRTRQKHLRLDAHERSSHEDEFAGQLHVQFIHLADVGQEIFCDGMNGNVLDVQLIAFDEEEQQVEGAFELR